MLAILYSYLLIMIIFMGSPRGNFTSNLFTNDQGKIIMQNTVIGRNYDISINANPDLNFTYHCVVGIATGYWLDNWEVGVRVPLGLKIFSSPCHPDWLWGPPTLLSKGYWAHFPRGKMVGAWSWPLTSNWCQGQEKWIYTSTTPYTFTA
jgi:hypothetical protein